MSCQAAGRCGEVAQAAVRPRQALRRRAGRALACLAIHDHARGRRGWRRGRAVLLCHGVADLSVCCPDLRAICRAAWGRGGGIRGIHASEDGGSVRGVRGARSHEGGKLVGVGEAGLAAVVEHLDLHVELAGVLVHDLLQLLGQSQLLIGQLLGQGEVVSDGRPVFLLLGVGMVAAVGLDPLLYAGIPIVDLAHQLVILAVLVCYLVLQEAQLLGQVLGPADPLVEDQRGIERLDRRHLPDEVDG